MARKLAEQAWFTPDPQQEAHWRENVERLSAEKERLEAELSARSAAYRQARRQVTLEELQRALPKDAVLVDILQYQPRYAGRHEDGRRKLPSSGWSPLSSAMTGRWCGSTWDRSSR